MAIAADPCLVAHRLGNRHTQRDADILNGVVRVNVQITFGFDIQVDQTVTGDLVQHVVQKGHAGIKLLLAGAVQVDRDANAQQSLEESSIDLWLDGYGTSLPSKRASIYYKGAVVALALDLKLQAKNGKSLKGVMLAMNAEFGRLKKGYTKADFIRICEQVYGGSLQEFFQNYVEKSTDITTDLQAILAKSGVKFENDPEKGWTLVGHNAI